MAGPAEKKQINKCRCRDGYRTAWLAGSSWQAGSEDCSATLVRRSPRGGGSNQLLQIFQPPSLFPIFVSSVCLFMSFMRLQLCLYAARSLLTILTRSPLHTHTHTLKPIIRFNTSFSHTLQMFRHSGVDTKNHGSIVSLALKIHLRNILLRSSETVLAGSSPGALGECVWLPLYFRSVS